MVEILMCILIADFITGLFHWVEDTYGTVSDSWMSKNIWQPNILHHKNPSFVSTMSNFISRNYLQWVMAGIFLTLVYFLGFFCWQIALVAVLASFGGEVHTWCHNKTNHWSVELLQEMGLIQTKLHHSKHHIKPYDRNYCALTNWVNPILERLNFWKGLEWCLSPLITVKRGSAEREGY